MILILQKKFNKKFASVYDKIFLQTKNILKFDENIKINVWFLSENKIKELNQTFRYIDSATDVLSFPYVEYEKVGVVDFKKYNREIDKTDNKLLIGEIFICPKIAKAQARQFKHGKKREFAFLFLHGLLHLLGFDHIDNADRIMMEAMQRKILLDCEVPR